ncbi:hypothetical protein [Deinococcus aquatilis]|uniref:hypothetical protein n=1 Tax=Deinococcus aquatilis TaxID=519440 RepID=UPI00039D424E|nr:hypothetical protein [Deinococcus aquatilis]
MKKSLSLLPLMLALAAGSAAAASAPAGSTISNTATASYADDNGTAQPNVLSNNGVPVTTTVQAVPSFTILPNSVGTPLTAGFTPSEQKNVKPGQTNVAFTYVLTNTGNVPNESYSLGRATFNSGSAGLANVRYYLETGTSAGFDVATDLLISNNKISGLAPDAQSTFYVVYDIPSTAVDGQKLGLTPVGTRDANSTYDAGQTFTLSDSDNYNQSLVTRVDAGNLGPRGDADANGTLDGTATPAAPYNVALGTTTYNQVIPSADTQTTLAPASPAAQAVYFSNTVRNSGNRDDRFTLTVPTTAALDAAGFPVGSVAELFTADVNGVLTPVTTTPLLAADPDGAGTGLGGSFSFTVRVSLPANAMPDLPGTVPSVTVTATSTNDPAQSDTTLDRVQIERGLFGNATAGSPGTPAADPTLNPTKPGTPGQTVPIPMDLYNAGNVSGTYTLVGSVTFTDANGQPVLAPITYYTDTDGNGVADNATPIVTQTVAAGAELKLVGVVTVPAGAVTGTATAAQSATLKNGATTVIVYSDNNDTVQVGLVGGIVVKKFVDNTGLNDAANPYPAEPTLTTDPANYNAGSQAKPTDVLRYVIYGRNTRNAVIKNFVLSDTLPVNSALRSLTATYNDNGSTYTNSDKSAGSKVMYRVDPTGVWSATAPTNVTLPSGTVFQVAYDWNNDNLINNTDILPSGAELKLVFKVTVN